MEQYIKAIHHISLKCTHDQYQDVLHFYHDLLGLKVEREWDGGIMLNTGNGLIEIFTNSTSDLPQGNIRHLAFAVTNVEALVKRLKENNVEVFVEPKDIVIPSSTPYSAKIAFVKGVLDEQIELFEEK